MNKPDRKKWYGLWICMLVFVSPVCAQFVGGSTFFVKANTPMVIDSFSLQPTADMSLSNTSISISHVPIPPAGPTSGSITRVYQVSPPLSFKGTTGVYYLDAELNGNNAALLSSVYDDGVSGFTTNNMVTLQNINNNVVATTGINTITIARLTAVEAGTVLPVKLISFTAKADGSRSLLEWATAMEQNCDRFDIERSKDGSRFAFLLSERSKGNSFERQDYQVYDNTPMPGWNYYRLKQIDIDGRFVYSAIASVYFGHNSKNAISVFPNPVGEQLNLFIAGDHDTSMDCYLMDATGRIIRQQVLNVLKGNNTFTIDVEGIASGNYFLKVGTEFHAKVLKQ
jgi:hypothetical protein